MKMNFLLFLLISLNIYAGEGGHGGGPRMMSFSSNNPMLNNDLIYNQLHNESEDEPSGSWVRPHTIYANLNISKSHEIDPGIVALSKRISIPSKDLIDVQLYNGLILTSKELSNLSNVVVDRKSGLTHLTLTGGKISDLNLKSQGVVDIRDFVEQKRDELDYIHYLNNLK